MDFAIKLYTKECIKIWPSHVLQSYHFNFLSHINLSSWPEVRDKILVECCEKSQEWVEIPEIDLTVISAVTKECKLLKDLQFAVKPKYGGHPNWDI